MGLYWIMDLETSLLRRWLGWLGCTGLCKSATLSGGLRGGDPYLDATLTGYMCCGAELLTLGLLACTTGNGDNDTTGSKIGSGYNGYSGCYISSSGS